MSQNLKKAVITGGAGFIGSHLTEELIAQGYQVTVIDDLSSGKVDNLKLLKDKIEFGKGSVTDFPLLQKQFRRIDYVFHLGAIPSVQQSIDNPGETHEVSAGGTVNVLMAASENKVKKVIYASSSAIYGDAPGLPKKEDMLPSPMSPYAAGKLAGEYYCSVFSQVYRLPTVALRYFNVFGPRQDPNSQYAAAIPKFITLVLDGKPPVIFGDGEQTRDFTYVADVVRANILASQSEVTGVFNISRGVSISINELLKLITKATSRNLKPVYQPARTGDIKHSYADITKSKALGYTPEYDLEYGLAKTLESLREK